MIGRGKGRYLDRFAGALLTAALSILSAGQISDVIRDFIDGSIVLTTVVAQREGALA
jgi:ribose/xylose/arabinose/galactoside ABC-type transport system permease subunit